MDKTESIAAVWLSAFFGSFVVGWPAYACAAFATLAITGTTLVNIGSTTTNVRAALASRDAVATIEILVTKYGRGSSFSKSYWELPVGQYEVFPLPPKD